MSFDLEKAIAAWRRPFEVHAAFSDEDIEELEGSLRDRVEALTAQGLSEKEAFHAAQQRVGSFSTAETEYRKVLWGKLERQHRLVDKLLWRASMFKNFLITSLRSLRRQKGHAIINIVGLATGIAASVLVLLFVRYETGFDKHHAHAENLYRVGLDSRANEGILMTTLTQPALARTMMFEFPDVVNATRIHRFGRVLLGDGDRRFNEERFFWADSAVFDLFTIPFVEGDPSSALTQPYSLVLTEEMARKYFGDDDPIGRTLRINNSDDYKVTGVIRPICANSHLELDFLASLVTLPEANSDNWMDIRYQTYVLLREEADPDDLVAQLPIIYTKYAAAQIAQTLGKKHAEGLTTELFLEPLTDIYLHSDAEHQVGRTGDVQYVYIMSAIAFFILLIACINFMNLTTAASARRAKEVGVRKAVGSKRSQLVAQFLGESVLMAFLALLLAYAMVWLALPAFQSVTGVALALSGEVALAMIAIAVGAGLLAGVYPAFVVSAFKPTAVLKGRLGDGARRSWMRSGLVVTQFAISITLLVGTTVVYRQLQFIQNRDLGFDKEHVVVLPIETRAGPERFDSFRSRLLENPDIVDVAASSVLPGPARQNRRGFRRVGAPAEELYVSDFGEVSFEYTETLGLEMATGRSFSREHPTDVDGFLFNAAAARMMGWDPEEAVGKMILTVRDPDRAGPIIGVFEDAHFGSLHETVQPLIIGGRYGSDVWYMPIRIREGRVADAMAYLEREWASFEPEHVFTSFFLDEDYGRFYEQERRLGRVYGYFTALAVFIACLGLFGLAAFVTQQRTKEIGVRKVLGASVAGVVVLLSREFTALVLVAAVIAFPVSYFGMTQWLQNFAYATPISADVFLLAGVAAVLIAWMTVGYHTIKAATLDPVRSLRYE